MGNDRYLGRKIGPYEVIKKQTNPITNEIEYVCKVENVLVNLNKKKMKQIEKVYATRF